MISKVKLPHVTNGGQCRDRVQLTLDVYGIYARIDTQILIIPHILLFHLADLDNDRKPDIGTLKKDGVVISSEFCIEVFKAKFLPYVNEVLFEMVKAESK